MEERERLQLRGLLPPRAVNMEVQVHLLPLVSNANSLQGDMPQALKLACIVQVGRLVDDLLYGRDYVEPDEVKVSENWKFAGENFSIWMQQDVESPKSHPPTRICFLKTPVLPQIENCRHDYAGGKQYLQTSHSQVHATCCCVTPYRVGASRTIM